MLKILVPGGRHAGEDRSALDPAIRLAHNGGQGGTDRSTGRQALMPVSGIAAMRRDNHRQAGGLL